MNDCSRILVLSTRAVTGGPELLHQLVATLVAHGAKAAICYFPFGDHVQAPGPYARYGAPIARFEPDDQTLVIVPEVLTKLLRTHRVRHGAVWWLSVDNYFRYKRISVLQDMLRRGKAYLSGASPSVGRLRNYRHFAQSHYAADFLGRYGIQAEMLSDYLGQDHLERQPPGRRREDMIVYSPKKGLATTLRLQAKHPQLHFVPIQNLTSEGVAALLARAKVYIDFGHHPGKDRIPREAAIAGCCVITGRRGSAAHADDVGIPDSFRIDESGARFTQDFGEAVRRVLTDFERCSALFEPYRESIRREPGLFQNQVASCFRACLPAPAARGAGAP